MATTTSIRLPLDTTTRPMRRQSSASPISPTTPHVFSHVPSLPSLPSVPSRTPSISSPSAQPRVQLVPHTPVLSFDTGFSETERQILDRFDGTVTSPWEVSSPEFSFEDLFDHDEPRSDTASTSGVSSSTRRREGSPSASSQHGGAAAGTRSRINGRIAELYRINGREARHARK